MASQQVEEIVDEREDTTGVIQHGDPPATYETWTPADAEKALAENRGNRRIRESLIDKYARDMKNGNWNYSAPIWFGEDGSLFDGQHRLLAQVLADVTIRWLVVREVPLEAKATIDINGVRSLTNILQYNEEKYYGVLSPILRAVTAIRAGRLGVGRYAPSIEECLGTLDEFPDIRHSAETVAGWRGRSMTPLSQGVMGAAHWMISQVNGYEEADQFMARLATLTNEQQGSPVLALSRRVNEIQRQRRAVRPRDMLAMTIKAFNYDAEGHEVYKLALYSKTGEFVLQDVKERTVPWESPDIFGDDEDEVVEHRKTEG